MLQETKKFVAFQSYQELTLTTKDDLIMKFTKTCITSIHRKTYRWYWPIPPNLGMEFTNIKIQGITRYKNQSSGLESYENPFPNSRYKFHNLDNHSISKSWGLSTDLESWLILTKLEMELTSHLLQILNSYIKEHSGSWITMDPFPSIRNDKKNDISEQFRIWPYNIDASFAYR